MAGLDDPKRLAEFSTSLLSMERDEVLERCVQWAALQADAPIGILSFVLKKLQIFRSAVGLPPDLDATRATSRSLSFCQFVVKTEAPFIVSDARSDARLPVPSLGDYGILAYAGVPIRVNGQILGALSVADERPRVWDARLVDKLRALAGRVSERLQVLSELSRSADEITLVPPKNLAARASVLAQIVQRSLAEVGPIVRLAKSGASGIPSDRLERASRALSEADTSYEEMMSAIAELCVTTQRVEQSVLRSAAEDAR